MMLSYDDRGPRVKGPSRDSGQDMNFSQETLQGALDNPNFPREKSIIQSGMTTDVIDSYRLRCDSQWLTRHPATSMTPPDEYNRVALDYITTNKKKIPSYHLHISRFHPNYFSFLAFFFFSPLSPVVMRHAAASNFPP
ncbi:hypothetical protein FALCPG4_009340 [Fusarium falciforme]